MTPRHRFVVVGVVLACLTAIYAGTDGGSAAVAATHSASKASKAKATKRKVHGTRKASASCASKTTAVHATRKPSKTKSKASKTATKATKQTIKHLARAAAVPKHAVKKKAKAGTKASGACPAPARTSTALPTGSGGLSGTAPTVVPPSAPTGQSPLMPETEAVTWYPLNEQFEEPDTLFLLDPTIEDTLTPGLGGLITGDAASGTLPWQPTSGVITVPGKYRTGLQSVNANNGYLWMPLSGYLPTNQFTVEMWLKADIPWSQEAGQTPFAFVDNYSEGVRINIQGGRLQLVYSQDQSAAGPTSDTITYNASAVQANQWVNVAFTYDAGTLDLYVNGALAGSAANVAAPQVWSDPGDAMGMSLGGALGQGATDFTLSDLRISRDARVPGQTLTVSSANALSVSPTATTGQTVNENLLGGLHTLGGPETQQLASGVIPVMRTDKLLTATPIKLGAPDAQHPSAGISGAYSYDWQVVDRDFAYYASLGVTPYISIDSTPQILGGSVPPFSGTQLTTDRSYESGFSPQVPNSLTAWGDIVKDLVYHVTVQDGYNVPAWGVWNEPNNSTFWDGSLSDYLSLYQVTAEAVKSVNPNLEVGGPETSWNSTWVQGLINYCATNDVPLDFVSWHYYTGNLGDIAEAAAQLQQWSEAAGIATPKMIVGEWAWQSSDLPGSGDAPFASSNWFVNDWAAAFDAQALMMMQRNGVDEAFYTNPVADPGATGWSGTGLMSENYPWATYNVFKLWTMLEPNIVQSNYSGDPGVMAQASTGPDGKVTVLLANLHYREDVSAPVTVSLPASWAGGTVQDYVIDDQHSDAYDAGVQNADLEQLPGSTVSATGSASTVLLPRSVHLLVISPPA